MLIPSNILGSLARQGVMFPYWRDTLILPDPKPPRTDYSALTLDTWAHQKIDLEVDGCDPGLGGTRAGDIHSS